MVRRTKDEAEQTRQSLLDAAEKVFLRQGVVRTSLQEIAEEAGVTRGAIYWHFKDKTDLLDCLAQRAYFPQEDIVRNMIQRNSSDPLRDVCEASKEAMHLAISDGPRRRIFTILTQKCEYAADEMKAIMARRVDSKERAMILTEDLFRKAQELGMLAEPWTPRAAAKTLHWIFVGLINSEMERAPDPVREKEVLAILEVFVSSLRKKPLIA